MLWVPRYLEGNHLCNPKGRYLRKKNDRSTILLKGVGESVTAYCVARMPVSFLNLRDGSTRLFWDLQPPKHFF
jgi:hypothetical protein